MKGGEFDSLTAQILTGDDVTVGTLIKLLKKYDPDFTVIVGSHNDDPNKVTKATISFDGTDIICVVIR